MENIINTSRVSIITKSEIKYEGTLHKINPEVIFVFKFLEEKHNAFERLEPGNGGPQTRQRNPAVQPNLRNDHFQGQRHKRSHDFGTETGKRKGSSTGKIVGQRGPEVEI
jgi:hypothetical protein